VFQTQSKALLNLTKLAASKDLATYTGLEVANPTVPMAVSNQMPLDDESMARLMMAQYTERGIDPSLALSVDSDPLEDFGDTSAFH